MKTIMYIILFPIFSLTLCHGKKYEKIAPDIELLTWPPAKIKVLTGSTVELLWRFRIGEEKKLKFTSWYYLNAVDNRKQSIKLLRKDHTKNGDPEMNPSLDEDKKNRSSCSFSKENQIWTMKCRITKANADDSADYGIQLVVEDLEEPISNASTIEIVDLMLNRKDSDVVVQSWINRKTELNCAIHRKVNLTTNYEWSVVTEEKDITTGITRKPHKTSYTFIPLSKRDFGKYKCKISTRSTTEEHMIELQQIDFPGAPRDLKAFSSDKPQKVRLEWKRPLNDGGTKIKRYVVETWLDNIKKWKTIGSTTRMSVAVDGLKFSDRAKIRVCSQNKVGAHRPRSCSQVQIRLVLPQRAHSGSSFTDVWKYLWVLPIIFIVT